MTVTELQDQLLTRLAESTGRGRGHWRRVIGEIRVSDTLRDDGGNWEIRPTGAYADVQAAQTAAAGLRENFAVIHAD